MAAGNLRRQVRVLCWRDLKRGVMPVIDRDTLAKIRASWEVSTVVGFTSGTFDLLHPGHIDLLERAKEQCDILVVGVNSDESVRSYKAPGRPIQSESSRLRVLASLACVDYAFLFGETRNQINIERLKPTIYFKGGDYSVAQLSSAPLVAQYGGRVKLIPYLKGESTTEIIDKIFALSRIAEAPRDSHQCRPVAFLDRDGTLIQLIDYLANPEQVKLEKTVIEGLQLLKQEGYSLVIITNQPGIGLGYHSEADFYRTMLRLFDLVSEHGILFDKVYFSPHSKSAQSHYRKPGTGMFDRALRELSVDVANSFVIGDSIVDMEFAQNAGLPGILVGTGKSEKNSSSTALPNFLSAVQEGLRCVRKSEGA